MEQPFIDGFLKAEAEAREALITKAERQVHLAKQFARYDKMQKVCKNKLMEKILEKAKIDIIKLMEKC